jgi:ATP-dependent helicase/DNAse subunit B
MANKNYSSTWVSHSSMGDFLKCPRLYYLRNVYKDPVSRNKITIIEPPLALGQIVHEVLEELSKLPSNERFNQDLIKQYNLLWEEKVAGKKGGFKNSETEEDYKARGEAMIRRVIKNPGVLQKKAIKIKSPDSLPPRFTLSEEDEIILCGKVDWLSYNEKDDSVSIIDFKTSRREVEEDSLQLPIYYLLTSELQSRKIKNAAYWYLEFDDEPKKIELGEIENIRDDVLQIAKRIKLARSLEHFKCPKGGCKYCIPYEQVLGGRGELVGVSDYQDIYALIDRG